MITAADFRMQVCDPRFPVPGSRIPAHDIRWQECARDVDAIRGDIEIVLDTALLVVVPDNDFVGQLEFEASICLEVVPPDWNAQRRYAEAACRPEPVGLERRNRTVR